MKSPGSQMNMEQELGRQFICYNEVTFSFYKQVYINYVYTGTLILIATAKK